MNLPKRFEMALNALRLVKCGLSLGNPIHIGVRWGLWPGEKKGVHLKVLILTPLITHFTLLQAHWKSMWSWNLMITYLKSMAPTDTSPLVLLSYLISSRISIRLGWELENIPINAFSKGEANWTISLSVNSIVGVPSYVSISSPRWVVFRYVPSHTKMIMIFIF